MIPHFKNRSNSIIMEKEEGKFWNLLSKWVSGLDLEV